MDAIQAVITRRSIRRYKQGDVPEDMVQQLLQAAMNAPSAGNEQPWQFIVIRQRRILDAVPAIHPHSQMLKDAALGIVVCGDLSLEVYKGFWVQDCSAATQNILIAAHALGLGAVWLGFHPMEDRVAGLKGLLSLPEHIIPLSMVSIGWPAEQKPPGTRYRQERVHYDKW
ncbi:MAG: nitroreductase family protein [Syntrophobacteraceae bacterium]|jgi:nitroreductase